MKQLAIIIFLTLITFNLPAQPKPSSVKNLVYYVNPLTGTAASTTLSAFATGGAQYANTIPAIGVPFGMTQWSPQTRPTEKKCQPIYYYADPYFSGFRGTHWLSGSCTQDYGSVSVMPMTGSLHTDVKDYQCRFNHSQEISTPYFYSLALPRYNILAGMTATARCGMLRFTVNKTDSLYLVITPNSDKSKAFIKIDRAHHEIVGYNPVFRIYQGWGQPAGFSGYFVIQFQKDFSASGTFSGDNILSADSLKDQENEGAYVAFQADKGSQLLMKVGTSFTSIEEARKNLQAEMPGWDFEKIKNQVKADWEKQLEKITVNGGTEKDKRIFYTALYHSMQQPRLFNDVDGSYPEFYQQYKTGKLHQGNYYGDFSMWDIYRAELPLYEILNPSLTNDWVRSLIIKGQQGGWLPIFPCWNNYTSEMIGDHATAFIASAYLKGINDYDINEAYRLMRQNAFESPAEDNYINGKGRRAVQSYMQYGYIPMEEKIPHAYHHQEQTSRTLEYAYDDYSLAQVAKALHKTNDYAILSKRGNNYKHVFDKNVGFVNGKHRDGSWYKPFDPDKGLPFITEGTPRQYTFYVPQDIPGLAALMGGKAQLETALDSLFIKGQYWHGNEPGHQIPFLYDYTDHPWKTQAQVRKIMQQEYTDGPGGLSGNDDAGQISAWYVFAAMGFYPVDPVSGEYQLSSPIFDNITIQLSKGKSWTIHCHHEKPDAEYIRKIMINNKPYHQYTISYKDLQKGGTMDIYLAEQPQDELN